MICGNRIEMIKIEVDTTVLGKGFIVYDGLDKLDFSKNKTHDLRYSIGSMYVLMINVN